MEIYEGGRYLIFFVDGFALLGQVGSCNKDFGDVIMNGIYNNSTIEYGRSLF